MRHAGFFAKMLWRRDATRRRNMGRLARMAVVWCWVALRRALADEDEDEDDEEDGWIAFLILHPSSFILLFPLRLARVLADGVCELVLSRETRAGGSLPW